MKRYWFLKGLGFVALAALFIFGVGFIVMHLWNWLMPAIFSGVHEITYCQALGVLILSKILFGFGKGGMRGRAHWHGNQHWRDKMREKWANMTPEQRANLKGSWGRYCNWEVKFEDEAKANEENKGTI